MFQERPPDAWHKCVPEGPDLLDAVPGMVWQFALPPGEMLSRSTPLCFVSRGVEAMLGYPVSAWTDIAFWIDHIHPEDRERTFRACRDAIADRKNHDLEYRMIAADGRIVWVRDHVNVKLATDGSIWSNGVSQDITLQKTVQAERECVLRELRELRDDADKQAASLQRILDTMLEPLWVWDADARMQMMNKAGIAMFRTLGVEAPESWVCKHLEDVLREVGLWDRDGRRIPISDVPQRQPKGCNDTVRREVWWGLPQRGPQLFTRVQSANICNAQGQKLGTVTTALDLTRQEVFSKQRDRFLRVIAHELRTPLTVIKGYVQVLLQNVAESATARQPLQAIDRNVERLSQLFQNLITALDVEFRDEPVLEAVSLDALVRTIVERFPLPSDAYRLRLTVTGSLCVMGERGLLGQVLVALLDNAVRFSPGGGEITVSLTRRDGEALLNVADHGVGIAPDHEAAIFAPFAAIDADELTSRAGLGLSLYLAREIVQRFGGRIWYRSQPGTGTTFCVALPLQAPQALAA